MSLSTYMCVLLLIFSIAHAADVDNDGDVDLLVGSVKGSGQTLFYSNIGTPTAPIFQAETDPSRNPFSSVKKPRGSKIYVRLAAGRCPPSSSPLVLRFLSCSPAARRRR